MIKNLIFIHLLVCCIALSSKSVTAKENLLHCLAKEEEAYHRGRITSPIFHLNKKLINTLVGIGTYYIDQKTLKRICKKRQHSPSLIFLKLLILEPNQIFILPKNNEKNKYRYAIVKSSIKALISNAPSMLFEFISNVQALAPDAHCLTRHIPEIKYYMDRIKYLEGETTNNNIIDDPDKINIIFKKLHQRANIIKTCKTEKRK